MTRHFLNLGKRIAVFYPCAGNISYSQVLFLPVNNLAIWLSVWMSCGCRKDSERKTVSASWASRLEVLVALTKWVLFQNENSKVRRSNNFSLIRLNHSLLCVLATGTGYSFDQRLRLNTPYNRLLATQMAEFEQMISV